MMRIVALLLVSLVVAGCASSARGLYDPKDRNSSVIVGFVDMSDAGGADLDDVLLVRTDGATPQMIQGFSDYLDSATDSSRRPGYFWVTDLPPGDYQLAEIAGVGNRDGKETRVGYAGNWKRKAFSLDPAKKNVSSIRITTPGVYFIGAYKITDKATSFDFKKIYSPSEQKALKNLLHRTYGSHWRPIIEERLQQLGSKTPGGTASR